MIGRSGAYVFAGLTDLSSTACHICVEGGVGNATVERALAIGFAPGVLQSLPVVIILFWCSAALVGFVIIIVTLCDKLAHSRWCDRET